MASTLYTEKPWESLLFFTDPHVGSANPIARKDDYTEAILDKLSQIVQVAKKLNVGRLICGGDVWHSKSPTQTSHETVQRLIELWRDNPPLGIIGNHDIPWGTDDFDSLNRQPLGVLVKAGAYELLNEAVEFQGMHVRGIHYQSDSLTEKQLHVPGDDGLKILVLHINASMIGSDFPGGDLCYAYPWLAEHSNADVICLGHWHRDQGIESIESPAKVTGATHFINVGAVARNSLREDNLGRIPKCALIRWNRETKKLEIIDIKLKCAPDKDVFKVEERNLQRIQKLDVKNFLDQLNSGKMFSLDIETLLRNSTDDPKVLKEALRIYQESS